MCKSLTKTVSLSLLLFSDISSVHDPTFVVSRGFLLPLCIKKMLYLNNDKGFQNFLHSTVILSYSTDVKYVEVIEL